MLGLVQHVCTTTTIKKLYHSRFFEPSEAAAQPHPEQQRQPAGHQTVGTPSQTGRKEPVLHLQGRGVEPPAGQGPEVAEAQRAEHSRG